MVFIYWVFGEGVTWSFVWGFGAWCDFSFLCLLPTEDSQHDAYIQGLSGLDCHNEIAVFCHEPLVLEGLGLGL